MPEICVSREPGYDALFCISGAWRSSCSGNQSRCTCIRLTWLGLDSGNQTAPIPRPICSAQLGTCCRFTLRARRLPGGPAGGRSLSNRFPRRPAPPVLVWTAGSRSPLGVLSAPPAASATSSPRRREDPSRIAAAWRLHRSIDISLGSHAGKARNHRSAPLASFARSGQQSRSQESIIRCCHHLQCFLRPPQEHLLASINQAVCILACGAETPCAPFSNGVCCVLGLFYV